MRFGASRSSSLGILTWVAMLAACTGDIKRPSQPSAVGGPNGTLAGAGGSGALAGPGSTAGTGSNPALGMNPGAGGSGSGSCTSASNDTAPSVLRRLSNLEYRLTLQDLFQLGSPPDIESIPPDVDQEGFRTYAALQSVSAQHLRAYVDKAHALADELLADPARSTKVLGCETNAPGCLGQFVTRFGKLAYRRPLEAAELDAIVDRATADALDQTDQYRFAMELLLSSSSFLYRVEVGSGGDALATLTPFELAARLSFTLWGRAPDATLLDRAEAGELATPEGLASIATTMLADQRAQAFYAAFFRQWLGFEGIGPPPNPPAGWSEPLLADMARETELVVGDFAWGQHNLLDMLTANYTRATPALASYYGVPAPAADGTSTFPAGHVRANTGLLTHPSLLSAKRDGDLIAIRGNWLRRTFLCRSLSIPASVAETLGEMLVGLTRVQIVKKRNTETQCLGCHSMIDPIGIGFVKFDKTGRFDDSIDAEEFGIASALPDLPDDPGFESLDQLGNKLKALPEVSACLATKVFVYANGRDPASEDACTVEAASAAFAQAGNSFPELLKGIVNAPSFRLRRAAGVTP